MKRKPDVMATLVIVFCVGLVVSGFTTFSHTREPAAAQSSALSSTIPERAEVNFRYHQ